MRQLPERWCDATPFTRCGFWLGVVLLLTIIGGYCLPRSGGTLNTATPHRQWQTLRALQMQVGQHQKTPSAAVSFSPLDFQRDGTRLLRWQPTETGGEMVLDTQWVDVPSLFPRLAERNMQVVAFSLHPVNGRLQLTLQLEVIHGE
ncbi:PilO family type IV pilus biogenesis protein [Trabulsiella guamensis ATCC 49490]|uniref:PilO family type IV pilus biogenesis protein n=1 Tax=Trabulsiella guamensis ATCC 49490 TaxID=1005994 RepID=A0A085A3D4_9ENTR|nr:hypothetical protein [Trabulsiella guamensis]KFC04729.1 PilO family type IV pilus biogenesis protein [Trabulsiella guamensis ATCC 49490]